MIDGKNSPSDYTTEIRILRRNGLGLHTLTLQKLNPGWFTLQPRSLLVTVYW